MSTLAGPRARRVTSLASALIVSMVAATGAVAQDGSSPSAAPAPSPAEGTEPPGSSLAVRDDLVVVAGTPAVGESPSAEASPITGSAAPDAGPRRFRTAEFPSEAPLGSRLNDVISGGPGYIAVGGGSWHPRDYKTVVWVSEDGAIWRPADVQADAVDGAMEAVAALPGGGFVAVGRDSEPGGRRDTDPPNALVWHSDDGLAWSSIPPHETFTGAIMYDVATTADGVIAVGCEANAHSLCSAGRAWTSTDGIEWIPEGAVPVVPFTVSVNGDTVIAGGADDQSTLASGRAAAAVEDGGEWSASGPLRKRWSFVADSAAMGAGFVMAGWQSEPGRVFPRTTIFVSPDGVDWDRVTGPEFRRMIAGGLDAAGDLVLVVGIRPSADIGAPPVALWSRDMETFRESRFPDDVNGAGLELIQPKISDDGRMAIVVGAYEQQPSIWYSELR